MKTISQPVSNATSATADLLSLSEPVAPPPSQLPPQPQQNNTLLSMSATTTKQDNTADVSFNQYKNDSEMFAGTD